MLSKKTKYGLKALTYIARKKCEHPVLISEIAKSENISQKFLESILLTLRKNGILGSKKGKGGNNNGGDPPVNNIYEIQYTGAVNYSQASITSGKAYVDLFEESGKLHPHKPDRQHCRQSLPGYPL